MRILILVVLLLAGCSTPAGPSADDGELALVKVADGLQMPLWLIEQDGLLVLERQGTIRHVTDGQTRLWGDLRDRVASGASEQGLLGMAFLPDRSDFVIVSYTGDEGASILSRFAVDGGLIADSEEVLLRVAQPFDNHNGGHVLFGPDGMLYYGLGDGGFAGDPQGHGQNPRTLLGSILRLEVGPTGPYEIPQDNPFVDGGGAPEVWSYGLRNPWRFSFGPQGELYIADVGQQAMEEVNLHLGDAGGTNHGWNLYEGDRQFPTGLDAKVGDFVFPVFTYTHEGGHCSVTGGDVVSGSDAPAALAGAYVFGDFCSGQVWTLRDGEGEVLLDTSHFISSFAHHDGRLYLLSYQEGAVYRFTD